MKRIYQLIRLNRLVNSHRIKYAVVTAAHCIGIRHLFLRLDPIIACNLRCVMCYFSNEDYRKKNKGSFTLEEISRVANLFFKKTLQLIIGCGTEPTLHPNFMEIVRLAKSYKIPFVGITTNGQLLTGDQLETLVELELDELTLSMHGVRKTTYEKFMEKASFEKLITLLDELEKTKKKLNKKTPRLRINYTVNNKNLEELKEFFPQFERYDIHTIQIRPIMDIGGSYGALLQKDEIEKYNNIIDLISRECKKRGITLLANSADPGYTQDGYSSVILPAIKRYISPNIVWREDFQWRSETYKEFCKRIGWNKQLFRGIFTSHKAMVALNSHKYAARYEIMF